MPAEVHVTLDNLNTDFADDVRRALPLVVLSLYPQVRARAVPLTWREYDTYSRTTSFLGHIAVSPLTVAILIGGLLMGGRGMAATGSAARSGNSSWRRSRGGRWWPAR